MKNIKIVLIIAILAISLASCTINEGNSNPINEAARAGNNQANVPEIVEQLQEVAAVDSPLETDEEVFSEIDATLEQID